jgi:hypothetical protein
LIDIAPDLTSSSQLKLKKRTQHWYGDGEGIEIAHVMRMTRFLSQLRCHISLAQRWDSVSSNQRFCVLLPLVRIWWKLGFLRSVNVME